MASCKHQPGVSLAALLMSGWLMAYGVPTWADSQQADQAVSAPEASSNTAQTAKTAALDPSDINTGGAGDLLVAPTRVVLDGHLRAAEIMLNNKGTKEATYRISFTHVKMDDNGRYIEVGDKDAQNPGLKFADDIIRYSPHQVTLRPGETQVVKVMVRPSEGLAEGEYCSHLMFRAMPDASMGKDIEAQKPEHGKISVHLIPIYGVSIPIIVRHGTLAAQAKVSNARLSGNNLTLTITRSGNKSVYGDVIATEAGSDTVVGQLRGVAVLATNERRNVSIPLTAPVTGALSVEYRERAEDGGKVLDKTSVKM